ncbi:MAG: OsmC family protein, partial [Rikenellaceae bacterium]|nr:OsmC family protein [Rikenellaceae bacterium]
DLNGRGQFFSPTDMVAAALRSCMLTIMDMTAPRRGVDLSGTKLEITKVMAADPRRICEIVIDFHMPGSYDPKTRKILENAAHTCPVSKSLHPDLKQTIRFRYPD